jgi:hypothetical protein
MYVTLLYILLAQKICVATNLQIILEHTIYFTVNSVWPIDVRRMLRLICRTLANLCLLFIQDLTNGVASQSANFSPNKFIDKGSPTYSGSTNNLHVKFSLL